MGASGLGSLLVKEGFLTEQDRLTITKTCGQGSWAFAKSILAIGLLDEDELAAFFAERTKYDVAPKDFLNHMDPEAVKVLDKRMISKLEILPLRLDADKMLIGVLDPLDRSTIKQMEFFTGMMVQPIVVPLSQLYEGLLRVDPDFLPRNTSLAQFLANHVGAAWLKQRIVNGEDYTGGEAAPAMTSSSAVSDINFDDAEGDGVEEVDDDEDGIEAVEDDAGSDFSFKDESEDELEDDGDELGLEAEDDPFAGTKSTEAVEDDNDDFKVIMPDDPVEDDTMSAAADDNDDFKVIMPDDPIEDDDSPLDADDLAADLKPKGASKGGKEKLEIAPAIDDFGMDDEASTELGDELSASTDDDAMNLDDDFSAPVAVEEDKPPTVDDDAIFDSLDDSSPSLDAEASGLADFAAEDGLEAPELDGLSAKDDFDMDDDLKIDDAEFGADEETNVKIHATPKRGGFDEDEETAINLRPHAASAKGPAASAAAPEDELRDPGLTPTAVLNQALLRLSLSFDEEAVEAVLKDTLPRMGASGVLIKAGGNVHSWTEGKEGPTKLPKGAMENLTKKSQEGKWQQLALKKPESWTAKDLSLKVYRNGNWIWAHEEGSDQSEIFIEAVESFVNQLQGK